MTTNNTWLLDTVFTTSPLLLFDNNKQLSNDSFQFRHPYEIFFGDDSKLFNDYLDNRITKKGKNNEN